jgi:hypothetical protein
MGLVPRGPILQRGADVDDETPVALTLVLARCSCRCGRSLRFRLLESLGIFGLAFEPFTLGF